MGAKPQEQHAMHMMLDVYMQTVHIDRMTLHDYLTKENESDTAFGVRVKLSQSQISRLRRGVSMPSWSTISAIASATKNKVTANDWRVQEKVAS